MDESSASPLLLEYSSSRQVPWWRRSFSIVTSLSASEVSGAVGDLGTFIPIALALTLVSQLDISTTLIFTGFYNIFTGLIFNIPMPVQPMKSIAAVAVSELPHLTPPQIAAAGASTAFCLLLLGATGIMSSLYNLIPLPVVRGVQLSQGLSFAFSALKYMLYEQNFSSSTSTGPRPWLGLDGMVLCIVCLLFLVITTGSGSDRDRFRRLRSIPSALIVFSVGFLLCFIRDSSILKEIKLGPSPIALITITWEDWKVGFLKGAIPQIPLSILNSVIAVCKLSSDLFPEREASAKTVSVSVGVMNLIGCWFGAMPVCHGAGGLAGQYRFGGRSGGSVVILGICKLVIGTLLGNSIAMVLKEFPVGILGVLLFYSGIELAMASKDMGTKDESYVMLCCAAVSLTGSSAALGFFCGILLQLLLNLRRFLFSSTDETDLRSCN